MMDTFVNELLAQILSKEVAVAVAGVICLTWIVNRVFGVVYTSLAGTRGSKALKFMRRGSVFLPEVFGVASAWIPGWLPMLSDASSGERLLKGVMVGFASARLYKWVTHAVLGKDNVLQSLEGK